MNFCKTKLILIAFFVLVILSIGAVSATNSTDMGDVQGLNDVTVDLNHNITAVNAVDTSNADTGAVVELNNTVTKTASLNTTNNLNSSSENISNASVPSNSSYFHSVELSFVINLVDNYGKYNITDLASIYNVDCSCIKNILQLIRSGAYGSDLKSTLDHKDYVLNQQIKSLLSCQVSLSKVKNKRGSVYGVNVAEKILQMYGQYNLKQMAFQLSKDNINIAESDILSILYHIKMNDGVAGYGEKFKKIFDIKESYLDSIVPKLQSYVIRTDSTSHVNMDLNASDIIFTDVNEYSLGNTYTVRVIDAEGNAVNSGHVSFFVNNNLVYVCRVNDGMAVFNLCDVFKTFGQYTLTCQYNGIVKKDNITIGDISTSDFFKVKAIFEGVKIYNLGDLYKIKFISTGNKDLTGYDVVFSINNEIIGIGTVDSDGIASCKINDYVLTLLSSPACFIRCELYDNVLNDHFVVVEHIVIGTRSIPVMSKGSLISKWRDTVYELCDDGYHAYIDDKNYQLIEFDGSSFIVHVENINTDKQLEDFFKSLSSDTVKWDIVIINLAKRTYKINFKFYSDREWDYALKFPYGQLIINGNGATFEGNTDLNLMAICKDSNVYMQQLTLKSFSHCFYNYGRLLCSNMNFVDNCACKVDVLIEGSGSVLHNFNTAEFFHCNFDNNNAEYIGFGKTHMAGSILFAEPYSTTNFIDNTYTGKGIYSDSIFACKYSSIVINPGSIADWTYKHFIGDSFIHAFASVTWVNPLETIANDYKQNKYNPLVFNCSNANELASAFKSINHDGVMGSEVIINLVNTTYSFTPNDVTSFDRDYGVGYRGSFWENGNCEDFRDNDQKIFIKYQQHYCLNNIGFIPVTINGNGATIKISDNAKDNDNHFAFIGREGNLTLNNVKITGFNTAFINARGNLLCKNSDISENKIEYTIYADYGGVLRSFGGSSKFVNCIMQNNRAKDGTDFAYAEDGSSLELVNCTISQHYPIYATLKDSTIKCSSDLYKNHIKATSTNFIDNNKQKGNILNCVINNTGDFDKFASSTILADVTYIDFNCSCNVDLNKVLSRPGTIYIRSNGHNVKINSNLEIGKNTFIVLDGFTLNNKGFTNNGMLSLMNCNLKGCNLDTMFTNNGECSLSNCMISDNKCKNVFENKGSMTIFNSSVKNNAASDYSIFYNNGGSVVFVNDTFSSNSGVEIYNFRTPNCVLINTTGAEVVYKEPMSAVKMDLIKTGFAAATTLITGGVGYAFGAALGPCVAGFLLSAFSGAIIGGGMGLGYGAIESATYHDYSHLWSNVASFAILGVQGGLTGYSLGMAKYKPPVIEKETQLIKIDEKEFEDKLIELANSKSSLGSSESTLGSSEISTGKTTPTNTGKTTPVKFSSGEYVVKIESGNYKVVIPEGIELTQEQLKIVTQHAVNSLEQRGILYKQMGRILFTWEDNQLYAQLQFKSLKTGSFLTKYTGKFLLFGE